MHWAGCPGHCDTVFCGTESPVYGVIATDIVTVNRQRALELIVCDPEASAWFLTGAINTTPNGIHIKATADFIESASLPTNLDS
jgi:hypothetical protein